MKDEWDCWVDVDGMRNQVFAVTRRFSAWPRALPNKREHRAVAAFRAEQARRFDQELSIMIDRRIRTRWFAADLSPAAVLPFPLFWSAQRELAGIKNRMGNSPHQRIGRTR